MSPSPPTLPIGRPYLDSRDLVRLAEPIERGWVVQGPLVEEFEHGFAAHLAASFDRTLAARTPLAVACASGTAALHLGVAALGVDRGDEVIVPAFTWVATANCVEYAGARPIFVDIDLETFNIDWALVPPALTDRTVGVIPVHLFGLPTNVDQMRAVARGAGLWILEDAACGFGAAWRGEPVGTIGDAGCFSFHPRKAITTGEGGMLVTDNASLAEIARTLRSHGLEQASDATAGQMGDVPRLGFNYRLTDLQAALGCSQLAKAAEILAHRAQVAAWYDDALGCIDALRLAPRDAQSTHGWQAYVCLICADGAHEAAGDDAARRRDTLMRDFASAGIGTRPGTHAPAHLAYYATKYRIRPEDFPNAYAAARCSIALPLGAGMTQDDVARVCETIRASLSRRERP